MALALALGALPHPSRAGSPAAAAPAGPASIAPGVVPEAIADRYLATRPPLGDVTVVRVVGESDARRLLAATLQGVVNRTEVRIYLVGMRSEAEDAYWLDRYQADGLIDVVATLTLDQAVSAFATELDGYVLADPAEPWTINTATALAGARDLVVATPATAPTLQGAGLTEQADHVGRWSDDVSAYAATIDELRDELAYPGVAIQQPTIHNPRDLYVQQGILPVFTRPSSPTFDAVYDLIDRYPTGHPVYGYVSDTGAEEVTALVRLAVAGRFLVPTDTTDNLSFHHAVGDATRSVVADPETSAVAPCTADTVNVVLAFSDGDNLVIPEAYYPRADRWNSPRRGEVAAGWGISLATAVLMPSIWDHYVDTTAPGDEIVDLMGLGYAIPSLMPNAASHLADAELLRRTLGVPVHWSLDGLLSQPTGSGWPTLDAAMAAHPPAGVLLNYLDWNGPAVFRSTGGIPVIAAQKATYEGATDQIVAQVEELLAADPSERPLVNFFPPTVWNASYDQLADAMGPLQAAGVRVLTPSEAFACLPDPPAPPTTAPSGPTSTTTPSPVDPAGAPPATPTSGTPTYTG